MLALSDRETTGPGITTRISLALGGIGTGTVSLGGRGNLQDWEIVNRPAKGFTPGNTFFAIRTAAESAGALVRALEGRLPAELYEGWSGSPAPNAGLPRFRNFSFQSAYPLGAVLLEDPDMPVDVRIEAFNPLIPCDPDLSGIPVAVLRFVLTNKTAGAITASVCGSLQNFIGTDGSSGVAKANRNTFRNGEGIQGIFLYSDGVDRDAEQWGTMALSTTATGDVTFRTQWAELSWGNSLLDFWDDFSRDGRLDERAVAPMNSPIASLAVQITIPPNEVRSVTFLLTWHFPNRLSWRAPERNPQTWDNELRWIGNYYTTKYQDAWQAATQVANNLEDLEERTVQFVASLCESDLPSVVKEAALFNLSILRTQTCFRTRTATFLDGRVVKIGSVLVLVLALTFGTTNRRSHFSLVPLPKGCEKSN